MHVINQVNNSLPASPARSPPKRYQSAYRPSMPRPSTSQSVQPPIQYDDFSFTRSTITIDQNGKPHKVIENAQETILIARDWQKGIGGGESRAGYLGSGFSKYAFKVILLILIRYGIDTFTGAVRSQGLRNPPVEATLRYRCRESQ